MDIQNTTLDLLSTLQTFRASRVLRSKTSRRLILSDILSLNSAIMSDDFDFELVKPLLTAALAEPTEDTLIWHEDYNAVTELIPPPRSIASSLQHTSWVRNTSSFPNSSEYRQHVDKVRKQELGFLYVGLRGFPEAFFGRVPDLELASETVFKECTEGTGPPFENGWCGSSEDGNQDDVMSWFAAISDKLAGLAEAYRPGTTAG